MTCAEFETRLSAYMDGELSRWKRWKVETHLRHCSECRSMLEDLQTVDECLHCAVEASPAPEYITGAVMHRIPAMPPAWRRRGAVMPWAAGLAVAGVQAAALCGAYWWGFNRGTVSSTGVDRTGVLPITQSSSFFPVRQTVSNGPAIQEAAPAVNFGSGRLWSNYRGEGGSETFEPDPETVRALRGGTPTQRRLAQPAGAPVLQWKGAH